MKGTIQIKPAEEFDRLCQQYGTMPVMRSYEVGSLIERSAQDPDRKVFEFKFVTRGIKSDGNDIIPSGIDTSFYDKNPVFLWAHDRSGEPIGKMVSNSLAGRGKTERLEGSVEFMSAEHSPRAERMRLMYRDGFLNAVSISARILKAEPLTEKDYTDAGLEEPLFGGILIQEALWMETSGVPIPADKDAFIKRMAQGDINTDEFVLHTPQTMETEDGTAGIFYVQAGTVERAAKTIVDQAASQPAKEEVATPDPIEIEYDEKVTSLYKELSSEGLQLNCIVFTGKGKTKEWSEEFVNTYFTDPSGELVLNDDNTNCHGLSDVFEWHFDEVVYPNPVTVPVAPGVLFQFKPIKETPRSSYSGAVPFNKTKTYVPTDLKWNTSTARDRVVQWDGDGGGNLIDAFGWADESIDDPYSSHKLLHHDVVDGELVSCVTGVARAAQRLCQGGLEICIPTQDRDGVKAHLALEYAEHGGKAPWDRSLGQVYIDLHERLFTEKYSGEAERDTLRTSAESISTQLFGDVKLREPWQDRSDLAVKDEVWASILRSVESVVEDLCTDTEEVDARLDLFMERASGDYVNLFNDLTTLKRVCDTIKCKFGITSDSLDITEDIERIGSEDDEEITRQKLEQLHRSLGITSEEDTNEDLSDQDSEELGLIIDRLLQRVEDKASSGPSGEE